MSDTKRPTIPAAEEILGGYFPVLDHGFVALVDYMGGDADVERAARVSYGAGTRRTSATRGLIRYLRRHLHTTPSEMVEFKFHCAMPMFVARQWIRHRTASVNEYSGRYSLIPLLFYLPRREQVELQSTANRQGRAGGVADSTYAGAVERWNLLRREAGAGYSWLIAEDIAREIARIDLPLSTYTQWYWKIDLHNLLHFLSLRADPHAQWEIREYASVISGMVKRVAPLTHEAWADYQLMGTSLSRGELDAIRSLISVSSDGTLGGKGGTVTPEGLADFKLSPREIRELASKLSAPSEVPDFELDLSAMRSAGDVEREMAKAVPLPEHPEVPAD